MSNVKQPALSPDAIAARHGINLSEELQRGFAGRLVRRKARQLVGMANFVSSDRADLEQDLRMVVIRRLQRFNPAKAHWNAFVTVVIERHVATLLKRRRCQRRGLTQPLVSLSTLVPGENQQPTELAQLVRAEDQAFMVAVPLHDHQAAYEVDHDVPLVLAKLTDQQRDLCQRLMRRSVTQVARDLNVPRSTLQDRVLELRQIFTEFGLQDFLRNDP